MQGKGVRDFLRSLLSKRWLSLWIFPPPGGFSNPKNKPRGPIMDLRAGQTVKRFEVAEAGAGFALLEGKTLI